MLTPTNEMDAGLPRYFGSVSYWLRRAAGAPVAADALFDKRQKYIHRFTIADVNGPLTLTLPIVKPHGKPMAQWSDVGVSLHGEWWHTQRIALESAYGRTPFFEFYIDRFLPFISPDVAEEYSSVLDLNRAIEREIADILLLPSEEAEGASNGAGILSADIPVAPYWQPRADRMGFIPDLSVLDLIFCLGPEAALYIRRSLRSAENRS